MTKTLINDAFEDDPREILEWGYGEDAKIHFLDWLILGQRPGQAFMNVLYRVDPVSYHRLANSLVDPFYEDSKLPAAIDLLTSKD